MAENVTRACRDCAHLHREMESWELPHIAWWECNARPAFANLRSFPFKRTTCATWTPRREPRTGLLGVPHAD